MTNLMDAIVPKYAATAEILTVCEPDYLRAGDLVHVRKDGALSTVTSVSRWRGGSRLA